MTDSFGVKEKVVILTGGAGFLGAHYAKALRAAGAVVVVFDTKGQEKHLDITDESAVVRAVAEVEKEYKRIDVLINNAAMNPAIGSDESKKMFVPLEDYSVELWRKELEVNLTGMFICIKAVVPFMKKQSKGVIINVASEVSNIAHAPRVYNAAGKYKSPAYVTSKTGVVGLTRACAAQLGQFGIRVNAFSPGGVENMKMPPEFVKRFGSSNMFGRMAKPDEYNALLQFLCSDASSFMTGVNLTADAGKSAW